MNLTLFKEFIDNNISDFNPQNPQDLIRAEKILKAESRVNGNFSLAEIEEYLDFLKNSEKHYENILKLNVISEIYADRSPTTISVPNLKEISLEEIKEFSLLFSPKLKNYLSENIRQNKWNNLHTFYQHYSAFFDVEALEYFKEFFLEKNDLIIDGLHRFQNYEELKKAYPFCTSYKYYQLQSMINAFEFEDSILSVNGAIADLQMTKPANKVVLGEMLSALSYFRAEDYETKLLLSKNKEVADEWTNQELDFYAKISLAVAKFFTGDKNTVWINIVSVLCILFFLGTYVYAARFGIEILVVYLVINAVVFYYYRNRAKFYFSYKNATTKQEKLHKIGGSLVILMIYGIPAMLVVALLGSYTIETISEGKFPTQLLIVVAFFAIRYFRK